MSDRCDDHGRLIEDLAILRTQREALSVADATATVAVERLSERVTRLEQRLAIWGGVAIAIASIPLIERLINLFIPAARAAIGG